MLSLTFFCTLFLRLWRLHLPLWMLSQALLHFRSQCLFRCYFYSPSITRSLVFTVSMWKPSGCQGPSTAMLHRTLTLTLQKKPLQVHHGEAIFTTEYSKLQTSLDHSSSVAELLLYTGFCLLLLILLGALGTLAYQKRARLQVEPSTT